MPVTKRLDVTVPDGNYSRARTVSQLSGNIDVTFKVKLVGKNSADPQDWHAPNVYVNSDSQLEFAGYRIELMTIGSQILRYTAGSWQMVDENWDAVAYFAIGTEYTVRVTYAAGTISVYKDGTLILRYADPSPYSSGYFGLAASVCHVEWDDFTGSVNESFDSLATGSIADETRFGAFYVVTNSAGEHRIEVSGYSMQATASNWTAFGRSATLRAARELAAVQEAIVLARYSAALHKGRSLLAATRAFVVTTYAAELDSNRLHALTRQIAVAGGNAAIRFNRIARMQPKAILATGPNAKFKFPRTLTAGPMALNANAPEVWFYPKRNPDMSRRNSVLTMHDVQVVVDPDGYIIGIAQAPGRVSFFPRTNEESAAVGKLLWYTGEGSPEGKVAAPVGALYTRTDGELGQTFYVKEFGGETSQGWVLK